MGALAAALIVVVAIIIGLLSAFVVLRRRSAAPGERAPNPANPNAPPYRARNEHMEYYRPSKANEAPASSPARTDGRDPRRIPLPHCPLCDAAIGFDDARCPKCGHTFRSP